MKAYEVPWDILLPENWWAYWTDSAEYLARLSQAASSLRIAAADVEYQGFLQYLESQALNCRRQYGGFIGFLASVVGTRATCRLLSKSSWKGADLWPGWQDYDRLKF